MTDEALEKAIRLNQTVRILSWVNSRIKFIERDISRARNDFERDRLEEVRKEMVKWRCTLEVEAIKLGKGKHGHTIIGGK